MSSFYVGAVTFLSIEVSEIYGFVDMKKKCMLSGYTIYNKHTLVCKRGDISAQPMPVICGHWSALA